MEKELVIYIQSTQSIESTETETLEENFSHPFFKIRSIHVDADPKKNNSENEWNRLSLVMQDAHTYYPMSPLLCVDASTFSTIKDSQEMVLTLKKTLETMHDQQIPFCFLSRMGESCDMDLKRERISISLKDHLPLYSLLISAKGREILQKYCARSSRALQSISMFLLKRLSQGDFDILYMDPPLFVCTDIFAPTTPSAQLIHPQDESTKKKEKALAVPFAWWLYILIVIIVFVIIFVLVFAAYMCMKK